MMPEMTSREPPVGSSDSDSYHDTIVLNQPKSDPDQYRVKQLEEERDNLQKNMISLTSRLAQIEFRMSQAIANPNEDKDDLLRNLSQFVSSASLLENEDSNQTGEYLQQLSLQLRQQLDEVERLAKDRGVNSDVTSETIQKQQESLKLISSRLGLKGEDILTVESAQDVIDDAVKNLLMPQVEKEKLVEQLQTKVQDLERFIEFIQTKNGQDDLDLPKMPKQDNRGIIAKGINAIIKIGAVLPILLLRNIGCGKKDTIEKEQSDFDGTGPPNRTKDRRECIKPPEIRDLQHTVNLVKLASQRLRMIEQKKDESMTQLEKLVNVVRKQLSLSIAKIVSNGFKFDYSYLSNAVALVSSPIQGCFRGELDHNKQVEEHGWIVLWTFFELRDGHILIQAPKSALRHAFGINDPLLGRNESERQLLRTVSQNDVILYYVIMT